MQPQKDLPTPEDAELTELYQRYAYTLLHFIRRHVSTREDAEDVLLEVFMAAWEQNALASMRAGERLRFAGNMRCSEIDRQLNKREGAVRMVLARALNLLRDQWSRNVACTL